MATIEYRDTPDGLTEENIVGFFEGWPSPPSPRTHLRVLTRSSAVVVAVEASSNQVIGFISAVSDGELAAYIPFLEVLPAYRSQGVGSELVRRMLLRLENLYMVDVVCDPARASFYARFGMMKGTAMILRNYARQSGGDGPATAATEPS